MTTEVHDAHDDDVLTAKHGATTEWMERNGESLSTIEEGDTVKVIDDMHASGAGKVCKVVDVPDMSYSFNAPAIQIVPIESYGPRITIGVGKVSKDTDIEVF